MRVDREERCFRVQRIEDGLDQEQIGATVE
jgi:hypothetical protein